MKSSPTKKSEKPSKKSPSNTSVTQFKIGEHEFVVARLHLGNRQETRILTLADLARLAIDAVIQVEDVAPTPFPKPEPVFTTPEPAEWINTDAGNVPNAVAHHLWEKEKAAFEATHAQWEAEKAEFEKLHPVPQDVKRVTLWAPVVHVTKVAMDGMPLRIFHTARAVFLGAVRHEDSNRVLLYSPCLIDPNVQVGRTHFFPVAFAGLEFILYKNVCIGESTPQVAEIAGYPDFVAANKRGDYQFRMRSAYHHVEADLPLDHAVISVSSDVRAHNAGLIPTTDTREGPAIAKARAFNQMVAKPEPSA